MQIIINFVLEYPIQCVLGTWLLLAVLNLRASVNSETHRRRAHYKNRSNSTRGMYHTRRKKQ